MPEQPLKDKTAIAGIGWTKFSRKSESTSGDLAAEASLKAIEDAGLSTDDIDGIITYFHQRHDTVYPAELAEALGITSYTFDLCNDRGGSWNCGSVLSAAMAVAAGVCKNVLVYRAMNTYSEMRKVRPHRADNTSGRNQFIGPFGSHHAAATFGHHATAHMARFGTTTLDFAHLAVTERKHASLNQKAMMRAPISIEDHQNSRWIVYPFRLLDCCQQTDGGVAVVVTSAERARDLRHPPVYIMAGSGGDGTPAHLWETNGVYLAPRLYEGAGITPKDVSFAELYDPFTFMCMVHMEDFGLVPKGEAGAWVREGHNGLDGDMPVNTHGGLMSEAHIHGLNHVVEAVQQLRPEGVVDDLCDGPHTYDRSICRQVRNPEIALVCGEGGGSGLLLRKG